MSKSHPHVIVSCAVIVQADARILAAQRAHSKSLGGLWEFPGGKIEAGETPAEALIREIQEELGVHIRVERPLSIVHHTYAEFSIELHPFVVSILHGEMIAREHADLRWITLAEAPGLDWAAADIPVWVEFSREKA